MRNLVLLAGLLVLATTVEAADNAAASTSIGYLDPQPGAHGGDAVTAFSTSPAYTVPYTGVVTSWTVNGGPHVSGTYDNVALELFQTILDPASGKVTATVTASSKLMVELRFGTRQTENIFSEAPKTVVEDNRYGVRVLCPDGYKTSFTIYGGIRKKEPIWVKPDGSFRIVRGMSPGGGVLGGSTTIVGKLEGPRAHGTMIGRIRLLHHQGVCRIPRSAWRLRS
jgi:hypothetical protein